MNVPSPSRTRATPVGRIGPRDGPKSRQRHGRGGAPARIKGAAVQRSRRSAMLRPTPHTAPKGKIIVFGILFWFPLAGVTKQFLHYLLGLRRLGYDPYYIEDSARRVYNPVLNDL